MKNRESESYFERINLITRLMLTTFVVGVSLMLFYGQNIKTADINNIGNPTYRVQKNMEQTDAFVYAYNVEDYGADGSGNRDNTEIFQKLLNKTYELGGGIVYVPAGKYKVTGSLKIPKGVTLRGDWRKPETRKPITETVVHHL